LTLREQPAPEDPEALVGASRAGTPLQLGNRRNTVFKPGAVAAGVAWGTPYDGRRTYISLQVDAG
jgi:hypothetical protein